MHNKELWTTYLDQKRSFSTVSANTVLLAAYIFKSGKPANEAMSSWNENKNRFRNYFAKLSIEKQQEFAQHAVFEVPFMHEDRISLADVYTLQDTTGHLEHILGFVGCIKQVFPVYPEVDEHVRISNAFIKNALQEALKINCPQNTYVVDSNCYITGKGLLQFFDASAIWAAINNSELEDLRIFDLGSDTCTIHVIEREEEGRWVSFFTNARRSILKDFSLHPNCVCSNISNFNNRSLNRRTNDNTATHMVTVFDIPGTVKHMESLLVESETLDILNQLSTY